MSYCTGQVRGKVNLTDYQVEADMMEDRGSSKTATAADHQVALSVPRLSPVP